MAESRQVEADAATYLDQISRYFITRGKIISKIAKYPHVVSIVLLCQLKILYACVCNAFLILSYAEDCHSLCLLHFAAHCI